MSNTDLPADVDARQRDSFAAAWTALAVHSLAAPGTVSAVTLFEDLGWKGLRARDCGPEDAAFPADPGEEFPVSAVVRALARATHVLPTASSDPESVDAIVLQGADGQHALLVNVTDAPRDVHLTGAADAAFTVGPHDVVAIDLPGRAS